MNQIKPHLLIAIVWLLSLTAVAQPKAPTFPAAQLQQDYELFVRALKEAHPGLYRYTPKHEMEALFEATKKQIRDGMTEEEFYKLALPIIVKIRCGHTKWFRKDKTDDRYAFYNNNLFPLKLHFIDDKAYVIGDYSKSNNINIEAEVLSINGKTIPEIRKQINRTIPTDGYVQSFLNEELNHFFSGYYATFVDHQTNYTVTFKQKNKTLTKVFPGVGLQAIQQVEEKLKPAPKLPLQLTYLNSNIALLDIDRFFIPKEEQDFYAFMDSAFLDLKKKGTEHLVIDLRDNEGGEESFGGYLFSYLALDSFQYYKKLTVAQKKPVTFLDHAWMPAPYETVRQRLVEKDGEVLWMDDPYLKVKAPQANAFKGKVYILTNGLSFSVTTEFTSVVHHHKRATFVGEETGGAYYGDNSGVFTVVTLPNTKLGMGIPLIGFYSQVAGYPYTDRGIIPHHEVKRKAEDVIQNKDVVMDYTLRLIKEQKHTTKK
jgi:hypothetical protein